MIRTLLYIVIAVLALSFFGISLQDLVTSPAAQQNFIYLWHLVQELWKYLLYQFQHSVQDIQGKLPALPSMDLGN